MLLLAYESSVWVSPPRNVIFNVYFVMGLFESIPQGYTNTFFMG